MHQVAFNQEIHTSLLLCSIAISNMFSKVCALILYTGFSYNLDLCRATTSMASEFDFFFFFFFSSFKKSDLVTKMRVRQPVRPYAACQNEDKKEEQYLSPAVVLPLKPGNPGT